MFTSKIQKQGLQLKSLLFVRETLTELEAHLHQLEEDHKNKQLALSLDLRYNPL